MYVFWKKKKKKLWRIQKYVTMNKIISKSIIRTCDIKKPKEWDTYKVHSVVLTKDPNPSNVKLETHNNFQEP